MLCILVCYSCGVFNLLWLCGRPVQVQILFLYSGIVSYMGFVWAGCRRVTGLCTCGKVRAGVDTGVGFAI